MLQMTRVGWAGEDPSPCPPTDGPSGRTSLAYLIGWGGGDLLPRVTVQRSSPAGQGGVYLVCLWRLQSGGCGGSAEGDARFCWGALWVPGLPAWKRIRTTSVDAEACLATV